MAVGFPQLDKPRDLSGGSDTWDGGAGEILLADYFASETPPTGRLKYWNGSSWELKPLKYWNGSAWVEKPLKYWNGSAWV